MEKENKASRASRVLRMLLVVLVVLSLTAATAFAFNYYLDMHGARLALYNGKAAHLSAWAVSADCYAAGNPLCDTTTKSGFTPEAEESIIKVGQLTGSIRLLQVDKTGYTILSFVYIDKGYIVQYDMQDGKAMWSVHKRTPMITP